MIKQSGHGQIRIANHSTPAGKDRVGVNPRPRHAGNPIGQRVGVARSLHAIPQVVGQAAANANAAGNANSRQGFTSLALRLDLPIDTRTPPPGTVSQDLWDIVMSSLSMHLVFTDFDNPAGTRQSDFFELSNPHIVTFIDFRIPRTDHRLWTIDLRTHQVLIHARASHGAGIGRRTNGNQTRFVSNVHESHESSVGAYVTAARHSRSDAGSPRANRRSRISLKVKGLDATNSEAFERAIIFHGAHYVNGRRAGNSWGCPATTEEINRRLIPEIRGGTFVYAHL